MPRSDDPQKTAGELFDDPASAKPARSLIAHVDGGARGNPGPAGFGVILREGAGNSVAEISEYLGHQTNNFAEYSGLLAALHYAIEHDYTALTVFSDSELMVKQIRGQYKVSSPALKELHAKARSLIGRLDSFAITHVLREKNRDADRLANLAMDRGTGHSSDNLGKATAAREVNGVVKNGVVEFLGTPLPNGTFVKVRAEKP